MSTGVIIALIVIVAAVIAVAAVLASRGHGAQGGRGLKRRFGPEYDRAVARHGGDVKAAEQELGALVERHGDLRERPLESAERERFEARWAAAQELFVDSPREAVAEADRLVAEVADARGYLAGTRFDDQVAALAVHHAHHVQGYRRVHHVARFHEDGGARTGQAPGTEDLRAALVEARALFDELVSDGRRSPARSTEDRTADKGRTGRSGNHLPWGFHRQQTKEG
ncbi:MULTISPECIES: hypothetical protein [unclassified Streptomyces]|uniref:hypothetical protein n=1 Tax=unclassified Streptomyces TaxID=2593676 RepID=UPI003811CD7D